MIMCKTLLILFLAHANSFPLHVHRPFSRGCRELQVASTEQGEDTSTGGSDLNLTPELEEMTAAFASIADEKTRYKQLLYLANKLPTIDPSKEVPENQVPGCLSTVHVDCTTEARPEDKKTVVHFVGNSDGLLTKGLVALLVRGLSGHTADEIERVNPEFIKEAKISQSLTPGRNNGFLNMLAVMKKKAHEATRAAVGVAEEERLSVDLDTEAAGSIVTTFEEVEGKPMYNKIMSLLIGFLKPTEITLIDNSDQHAGHAGSRGFDGESHFSLSVASDAFEGLSLVQRHQLIYMMLGEVMPEIHALQITAKTPTEIEE